MFNPAAGAAVAKLRKEKRSGHTPAGQEPAENHFHFESGVVMPGLSHKQPATRKRAVELGPMELMALLEWQLRKRPRALKNARQVYIDCARELYRRLERARRNA